MSKKWQIAEKISKEFQDRFPEINPLVLQMLYNRGLKIQEKIDEFLNPDYGQDLHNPFLFKDMKKAVNRVFRALERGERIVVHGDYDADGVCGACLLVLTLKEIKIEHRKTQRRNIEKHKEGRINVYIPHRVIEGYGLNRQSVEEMAKDGTNLIITVDSGISNYEEIELANKLGMDVIITDHHHEPPKLPKAFAIINPQVVKEKYPFRDLAGVGVAFKLAQALLSDIRCQMSDVGSRKSDVGCQKSDVRKQAFEKWLLDLVAIGTVADMSPLLGENRTLVKYGLIVLNKTRRIGLQELIKTIDKRQMTNDRQQMTNNKPQSLVVSRLLDTWNIGFQIGPRLNAAGRLDHANKAYQLLITKDKEEAEKLAQELNETNQERQRTIDKVLEEAKIQIGKVTSEKKILFAIDPQIKDEESKFKDSDLSRPASPGASVLRPGWPIGIIGLVAGKLSDEFYRPVFIITKNKKELTSSGRSISEFNLAEALEEASEYLSRFGGHVEAAGFSIDPKNLDKFKEKMEKIAEKKLAGLDLVPSYFAEKEVILEEINWDFYENLEKFAPFGQNNPSPKFVVRDLMIVGLEKVGQDGKHLRLLVRENNSLTFYSSLQGGQGGILANSDNRTGRRIWKMIYFGGGKEWGERLKMGDKIDCLFEVSINQWNGQRELQLKVVDLKKSATNL